MIASRTEALAYLDTLIGSGIRPGLDRMRAMLGAAGNPQRAVPALIIGGTNGKGSTAAMLSAIGHAAGIRTGLYTSPHLVSIEERWRIDEEPIEATVLVEGVERLRKLQTHCGIVPTYFEALTLLAFLIFESEGCQMAILEVGMGGRLDATNVADPELSVITPVSLDHREWLGDTLEEIAGEKFGIARRDRPLVVAPQDRAVEIEIENRARTLGCLLDAVSSSVRMVEFETGLEGSRGVIETPERRYEVILPLRGAHQALNLATAIRAAELAAHVWPSIDRDAIERGIARTTWRGRLERFDVDGRTILVDGAHNPAGAAAAAQFFRRHTPAPRSLVFGVLDDKDPRSMLSALEGLFEAIVLTRPDSERGRDPRTLAELLPAGVRVAVVPDDEEAVRRAVADSSARSVVICGSLYLAGTAVRLLDQISRQHP